MEERAMIYNFATRKNAIDNNAGAQSIACGAFQRIQRARKPAGLKRMMPNCVAREVLRTIC
jgi:hypothetical protein